MRRVPGDEKGQRLLRQASDTDSMMAGVVSDLAEEKKPGAEVDGTGQQASTDFQFSRLAHDFHNLMNIIYGNISFVKMQFDSTSPIFEALTDAEDACERVNNLSPRSLACFSQGSDPVNDPVLLNTQITQVVESLATPAKEPMSDGGKNNLPSLPDRDRR